MIRPACGGNFCTFVSSPSAYPTGHQMSKNETADKVTKILQSAFPRLSAMISCSCISDALRFQNHHLQMPHIPPSFAQCLPVIAVLARIARITSCAHHTCITHRGFFRLQEMSYQATGPKPRKLRVLVISYGTTSATGSADVGSTRSITSAKTGSAPLAVHRQQPVSDHGGHIYRLGRRYGQAKTTSPPKNATVLIIRHAEKPETGKHLAPAGVRRAQAYPGFLNRSCSTPIR